MIEEKTICNCDGSWHIEVNGVTHYLDISPIHQQLQEVIEGMKATEADGWDMAKEFNCCPGDDLADAHNKALDKVAKYLEENYDKD